MDTVDFMVIGSGPSGVHAAQTLLDGGASVCMLDAGHRGKDIRLPDGDFESIRRTDPQQYRYWLGEHWEGLPSLSATTGAQLTPPKIFMAERAAELTPFLSPSFHPIESLATGGLGNGWGLGSFVFSAAELAQARLPVPEMEKAYQVVADRIGITATSEAIAGYATGGLDGLLPALQPDRNGQLLLQHYNRREAHHRRKGIFVGTPSLAYLTREKDGRRRASLNNLDFYTNEEAAWRPPVLLRRLLLQPRFRYVDGVLVTRFSEGEDAVTAEATVLETGESVRFTARKLLLACNVLGTARIVLRSLPQAGAELPLLCNPYFYLPSLLWQRLGRVDEARRSSLAQLLLFHDPDGTNADVATASLYSYSSLMLFRALGEAPLNYPDARLLLQYLLPAMMVAGVHLPDRPSEGKKLWLAPESSGFTGDALRGSYALTAEETALCHSRVSAIRRALRSLGCWPLRTIAPPFGASIHYAGTLPYAGEEAPFRLLPDGRLGRTRNVFVADGSGFAYLPAKGITLSLMANAHRTALNALGS